MLTGVSVCRQGCQCVDRGVSVLTGVSVCRQGCQCVDRGVSV